MAAETILVVDDAPDIQYFVCDTVLHPAGYQVLRSGDGRNALELALSAAPDLMLLDINLPNWSGLEVLQALRREGCTIPVILMTSYGTEETLLRALRLGARDFLEKPFTEEQVLSAVGTALTEVRWQNDRQQMARDLEEANQRLQRQLTAWSTLNGIGQAITATLDEADVYQRVVWGINQLMRVEAGSLYLVDEASGDLVLQISLGGKLEQRGGIRLKAGQGIAGWVAQNRKPALVTDVKSDPRFYGGVDLQTGFHTHAVLAVPLMSKGKVLGVIQVLNPQGNKYKFDASDQKLLEGLAAAVAVAVENARLHAKMRQTVSLGTLRQTAATLSHYINNSLTVIGLVANVLKTPDQAEKLVQHPEHLLEAGVTLEAETERIAQTLRVLNQATQLRTTIYQGDTLMIDIEPELRALTEKKS